MFAVYGLIGITSVVLSYILAYVFATPSYHHLNLPFELGYWLFFDAVEFSLTKSSPIHIFKKKPLYLFWFILAGAFLGLLFDIFGVYLAQAWTYPVVTNSWTKLLLYLDWGIFLLMIYSSYRVILYFLTKEFAAKRKTETNKHEKVLFVVIGSLGLFSVVTSIILSFFTAWHQIPFALAILGIWFLCEFIEYKRKRRSLIKDTFQGDWKPLFAVLIGSTIMAFAWETMNLPLQAWVYTNIPFAEIAVLGVPLFIIVGWPSLFIVYLSFYRAFFKGRDLIW